MVQYGKLESVFSTLLKNNPQQLVQDENDNSANSAIRILQGQLVETEKQIANITEFVVMGKASKALVDKQISLEAEVKNIKNKIQMESAKSVTVKGGIDRLNNIVKSLENLSTDQALRSQVQGWIRQNIDRITLHKNEGTAEIVLKNGYVFGVDLIDQTVLTCDRRDLNLIAELEKQGIFGEPLKVEAVSMV